ncbi:autotransporter domain-containing protein [Rhodanobacter sp. L36]|uniref:autotransporter outer membrane beta-barrel domain-containing protein n=1 Tax=Rhodanobacter sp. L36 TaxID=1747221 RepID=UPI00131D5ED0|nr:autotransporter domain-containing protein [Rhodanobacter sp. L36]
MLRTRHLAGAIAATLLFSGAAVATDFTHLIVFGDSLSDDGNISLATAPGIQPPLRFTTNPGSIGIENVANQLGLSLSPSLLGGTDYAWGGAGVLVNSPGTPAAVPTLTTQVGAYLSAGSADSKALYSIWGGANDIFYHATAAGGAAVAQQLIAQAVAAQVAAAEAGGLPPSQVPAFTAQITPIIAAQVNAAVAAQAGVTGLETADQAQAGVAAAAQQEVKLISQLQSAGVKNILVYNLPNIGTTPSATEQGASAAASLAGLSQLFNGQLNSGLGQMKVGIIPINAYGLLSEVVANPTAYGFTNATDPACGVGSSSVQCGPQGSGLPYTYAAGADQSYVFADGVHPTTAAHALLSQYVLSVLQAPEQISLLGEAPLQVSTVQNRVVRNQMVADNDGGETRAFVNIDYARQRFDANNGAPKTNSNDVNFTLGADIRAAEHISAGVALGVAQNNAYVSGGGGYKLQDISGLGYVTYHQGGGYIGGYANFGQSNFKDIDRRIDLGTMQRNETGKADGSHLGGGFTGGYWFDFSNLRTGPFANVDWESIKVNGYSENGNDSSAMWFGRQQRDALVSTLGWRLQGHFDAGNLALSPYAELAWNHDSKADARLVTAGLNSMNGTFALTGFLPDKTWGTADLGVTAQLTPTVTSWIGYSGRFSDDSQKYNSVNMGVKILF